MSVMALKNKKYIWIFAALTIIYIIQTFTLPVDPKALSQLKVNLTQYRLILLALVIPLTAVFCAALYGFIQFKNYAESIKDTKEGPAFRYLANGLMILAFSLPVTSIIGNLLNYVAINRPDLLPATTITRNYISLLFQFVTFILLAHGAEELTKTLKTNRSIRHHNGLFIIILSCVFTWLITTRPSAEGSRDAYFMPEAMVIGTLAIPYLYMWTRGIMANFNLRLYRNSVKGSVYKHALSYLAYGISGIVFLSIIIQFITTLSARLNKLSLQPILFLLVILVILYAIGYGLVAKGANKLQKIEEV